MGKTMQGGRRPGSGRPRQGEGLRRSVSFTLSPEAAWKSRALRNAGYPLNLEIEELIIGDYAQWYFNRERPRLEIRKK